MVRVEVVPAVLAALLVLPGVRVEAAGALLPLLGTGLALPDCECESRGILGELEDFATRSCPKPHSTR